ncbi:9375_t:CDS:2 [Ambispora gerdemannii]|uniref:9375_t:CDS:1 n=1 Tax=Ambispora gerdemannii TaxID=144530 RepID=A0A9N9HFE8_9GLOM|nr:9375_t:CDS:2 [Ambispora gerdemannii]
MEDNFLQSFSDLPTFYEEDLQKLAFQENEEDIEAINPDYSDIEIIISDYSVAIVFNTQDWEKSESAFKDIQYAMGKPGGETEVFCSYLDVKVKKET